MNLKDKQTAIILAIFLGGIGMHKFYLGKNFQGILYLIFCWTFIPAFFGLFEGLFYMLASQSDWDKDYNSVSPLDGIVAGDVKAESKSCPDCAEIILAAAKKCKHCGLRFDVDAA